MTCKESGLTGIPETSALVDQLIGSGDTKSSGRPHMSRSGFDTTQKTLKERSRRNNRNADEKGLVLTATYDAQQLADRHRRTPVAEKTNKEVKNNGRTVFISQGNIWICECGRRQQVPVMLFYRRYLQGCDIPGGRKPYWTSGPWVPCKIDRQYHCRPDLYWDASTKR